MKIKNLTFIFFFKFSFLTSDINYEDRITKLFNKTVEKTKEHMKVYENVNIEQFFLKKSSKSKYIDLIFEVYDRVKENYGLDNAIRKTDNYNQEKIEQSDNNEMTFVYLQIEKTHFEDFLFYRILIEIFERIQKLKSDDESYSPVRGNLTEFLYKKNVLNIDFKRILSNHNINLNDNTLDFFFFIDHCPSNEFKDTLCSFYMLFHNYMKEKQYGGVLGFIAEDRCDGKNRNFFNYPDYHNIYKNFKQDFIYGCGSQDYYDLQKNTKNEFPYMIISEHNDIKLDKNEIGIEKYHIVKYFKVKNNQRMLESDKRHIFNFTFTREIDLNNLNNKNQGVKNNDTSFMVNKIYLAFFNTPEQQSKYNKIIYFKQHSNEVETPRKSILLTKELHDDDIQLIRDYFLENIKKLNPNEQRINKDSFATKESTSFIEKNRLTGSFLFNNLECILHHINSNLIFLKYNFCDKNILFYSGYHKIQY